MEKFKTTLVSILSYLILFTTLIIVSYRVINEVKMAVSIHNYRFNTSQKIGTIEDVDSYRYSRLSGKIHYIVDVKTKNGYNEDIIISKEVSYLESQDMKKNDPYTFKESEVISLSKLPYDKVFTVYRTYLYTTPFLLLIPFVTLIALYGSKHTYKITIEHMMLILSVVGIVYIIYIIVQFIIVYSFFL